jgi:hypothetical protein
MKRLFLGFVLILLLSILCPLSQTTELIAAPIKSNKIYAIIISAGDSWLLPLLTPVTARLEKRQKRRPLLFILPTDSTVAQEQLLKKLKPKNILRIHSKDTKPPHNVALKETPILTLPAEPLAASLALAKGFWKKHSRLYACSMADGEAYLQGATLAAMKGKPLLLMEEGLSLAQAQKDLTELGKIKVTLVADSPKLKSKLPTNWRYCSTARARVSVIKTLGKDYIRNVAIVSSGRNTALEGQTALLGPYYCLCRKSPLLVMSGYDGSTAQKLLESFVRAARLKPVTITILGGYDDIGLIEVTDRELLGEFDVSVEPGASSGAAAQSYGVGRLFHRDLSQTSLLFARILYRHRLVGKKQPSVVLMNNPKTEYGAIPLAEAIGRLTAKDLQNVGIKVKQFNDTSPVDPLALKAAAKSSVFVFQGHIVDLLFLGGDNYVDEEGAEPQVHTFEPIVFTRAPLVFLQSCTSIDGNYVPTSFDQGATAVVGSSTSIHSSSGSAFNKVFCDGLARQKANTLGEALKSARNYFLCLYELKKARGHKEQAKVFRVAMSFRLMGDPEMLLDLQAGPPKKSVVGCKVLDSGKVQISIPNKKHPKIETPSYFFRAFPGGQTAGLVKRLKNKEVRRITSTYYFALKGLGSLPTSNRWQGSDGAKDPRAVYLYDALHKELYLLYYPKKEERGAIIELNPLAVALKQTAK